MIAKRVKSKWTSEPSRSNLSSTVIQFKANIL